MPMTCEVETALKLELQILDRVARRVRDLRVLRRDGLLVLEGSADTFHAKQLASHAAMQLVPDSRLLNEITVGR